MAMVWDKNSCPVEPPKSKAFSVAHFSHLPLNEEKVLMKELLNDAEILIANTFLPMLIFDKDEVIGAARSAKVKLERLGI